MSLRERKKAATREALSAAALRLALEQGADKVRVDDIADAAGVSPRTYNNYFASREQAIVAAITAERALRVAAALRARADQPLADAVVAAVVEQYATEPDGDALTLITTAPRLRAEFVEAVSEIRQPVESAIAERVGDPVVAAVLAASVSAAARVALEQWVRPLGDKRPAFVVVHAERPLPELLREALAVVAPALRAADGTTETDRG
ncbi:MAG TPA: TetR family transcriptional regulator [Pseudonocardiaceae bacterium]|nr:TetR family transcriptional regulator [Pseudonocardiaceae bacterium]